MKEPLAGELWLDEKAWHVTGKPRLLLVTVVRPDGTVAAHAIQGGDPGRDGIPLHYFREVMSWQGFWSLEHKTLPRLSPPFAGNPLENIPKAYNAAKLSGTADLINSIIPSFQPSGVQAYNVNHKPVIGASLDKPASSIPAGAPYLRFSYSQSHLSGSVARPEMLRELWFQKQANAWWLVRTLALSGRIRRSSR